jgi:alkyl hydroperoxide reductase subunit AhpF
MNDLNSFEPIPFDEETWRQMPDFLGNLPEPVCLHVWGDETASAAEREAARLAELLAEHFPDKLSYRLLPRRINYPYYPVIGIMTGTAEDSTDLGLRIIGLPIGFQMTSLIAAIQAASFRGQTLEPLSRLKLHRLMTQAVEDVGIEVLSSAEDEAGAIVAKAAFGAAASTPRIRTFLIVTDYFPEAAQGYSAAYLPHTVINKRVHFNGVLEEDELVRQIERAVKREQPATGES